MKKALALLLALLMCLSLAACGNSNDSANGKYAILIEMLEAERYDDAITFIRALQGTAAPSVAETTAASPAAEESHAEETAQSAIPEETTEPTFPAVPLSEEHFFVLDAVQTVIGSEAVANCQSLYKKFTGSEPRKPKIAKIVHISCDDFDGKALDGYLVSVAADVAWWHNEDTLEGASNDHFNIFIDRNTKAVYDSITTDGAGMDTKTDEGRAVYLLSVFINFLDGSYDGYYCCDRETAVEMTAAEISSMNAELNK